ncbi:T surface-antigen of pili [Corynebacterium felinum]|uniref:DUF5979 domain-containing protein n=1 Tax=Corynebacterium felinum TaxID=131318 RepID=UPI0023F87E8B|nr:DUF5979 domain-containing protein [Corynebacterium felinum]WJY94411.1 T surface-antigen of pili [Corynebacterium felinum]
MNRQCRLSTTTASNQSFFKLFIALVGSIALVASGILVAQISHAPLAHAAQCKGRWNNLTWKDGPSINNGVFTSRNGFAIATFDWEADANAQKGDTIELELPQQLTTAEQAPFNLYDEANGNVIVARGSWSGKKLTITVSEFADQKFNVRGKAEVALKWDHSKITPSVGFDGDLQFTGCNSNGTLKGKIGPLGPGGSTHDNQKVGTYSGWNQDAQGYVTQWSIGVSAVDTNNQPISVTDTAPDGWKFICDGTKNGGYSPVAVQTFVNRQPVVHQVMTSDGNVQAGTYYNVTGVAHEALPQGHGFYFHCTPEKITVNFNYGIHPSVGPIIQVKAVSPQRPTPGSVITNTAEIGGKPYVGQVFIPRQGGSGTGETGGFTVKKLVQGVSTEKEFNFHYECHPKAGSTPAAKTGDVKVKHNQVVHVGDLDKGLTCTITETDASVDGLNPTTRWTVDGMPTESVSIETRHKHESAIDVVAVNRFAPPVTPPVTPSAIPSATPPAPEPKVGGFKVKKEITGNAAEKFTNHTFTFTYTCGDKTGELTITGAGEAQGPQDIPVGTICTISEKEVAVSEGINWVHTIAPSASVTISETDPQSVTVTNTFTKAEPKTGTFKVKKEITGNASADFSNRVFTFDYTCGDKTGELTITGAGEAQGPQDIPVGTQCTIVERPVTDLNAHAWTATYQPTDGITITEGQQPTLTVTNTFTKPEPKTGNFTVKKELTGNAAENFNNHTFTFTYTCGAQTGELKITGAGEIPGPGNIPAGTECTVVEKQITVPAGVTWTHNINPTQPVTIRENETALVKVTNTFTTTPPAPGSSDNGRWWIFLISIPLLGGLISPLLPLLSSTPTPTQNVLAETPQAHSQHTQPQKGLPKTPQPAPHTQPKKGLANTGANTSIILFWALISMLLGLTFITTRKKKQH